MDIAREVIVVDVAGVDFFGCIDLSSSGVGRIVGMDAWCVGYVEGMACFGKIVSIGDDESNVTVVSAAKKGWDGSGVGLELAEEGQE